LQNPINFVHFFSGPPYTHHTAATHEHTTRNRKLVLLTGCKTSSMSISTPTPKGKEKKERRKGKRARKEKEKMNGKTLRNPEMR